MPATREARTISDQLRSLVRLQHIDNRLEQNAKLRGDLPDEIRDLEDERAGLQTRLEKYEEEGQEREVSRRQAELDVKEAQALIKKYEEQQLQVRNNREYDALTKEIEAQKQRIIDAERHVEYVGATAESHEAAVEEARKRLEELDEVLQEKKQELEGVLAETKHEEEELEALRENAVEEVGERYRKAYERLRDRLRDSRAVVPLERGAAAGFAVPPQTQVEIRQRNRIIPCEHTGRIIVDPELYDEVIQEMGI